ncbi:DMP19 family protein [Paenibacillus sp. sptzw28]|uniref:DMP19 family protein n=1 Tax=Paenibacillus sp. sptzw28 TaxID=715179 RepID=UPI001C6F3F94|nr:DUF4375 domain-containing protein [Paenibacillus sp. sptzw28]QYR19646.1 DMP19 family protein [Paenibacillus sp. sptzw28]
MNNLQLIVGKLLPNKSNLLNVPASEIVEHICEGIYQEDFYLVRDKEVLSKIPILIRDCVLLIDFDTELNMNGIFGYLENSTGKFIDETIEVLERIGAVRDAKALNKIKKSLSNFGLKTHDLNTNLHNLKEYQINNFIQTHGITDSELLDRIQQEAENLYINNQEENIFNNLIDYIEANKQNLIDELKEYL